VPDLPRTADRSSVVLEHALHALFVQRACTGGGGGGQSAGGGAIGEGWEVQYTRVSMMCEEVWHLEGKR
jgi:hypothetical protein